MISKEQVSFLIARKEKMMKLVELLSSHGCTYWDDEKFEFARSKDLLDFVCLGLDGLTMREVKGYLEVI